MYSLFSTSKNNNGDKVHRALYRITMLALLVVPPQDQDMSAVLASDSVSTPLLSHCPVQHTAPRVLRKKRGIRDLRAAFRKFQRPIRSSCPSTDTNDSSSSSSSTLSIGATSLLSSSDIFESAHSVLSYSYDGMEGAAECTLAEPSQHSPTSASLRRNTVLDSLRGAFKFYGHTSRKVSGTPFVGEVYPSTDPTSPPIKSSSEVVDASGAALTQADRQPVYISLPLPPPLRHEEVVADIPFVPQPLTRGIPVHARARRHADLTIPYIWRGGSARYH